MNSSKKDQLLLSALRAVASAVNRRDPYTSGHSERVAEYCDRLAISLNLSQDHRYFLSLSAWLHDLGNLSTPRYILRKPSALLHEEMEEVRVHAIKGAEMLAAEPRKISTRKGNTKCRTLALAKLRLSGQPVK